MAKRKSKISEYFGWGLIVLGVLIVLSALPLLPQSIVSVGPVSAEVSQVSSTRIIVGVVVFFLGTILVGNKRLLRIFR